MKLGTDSSSYDMIERGIEYIKDINPKAMTVEIGLREGGGSQIILDALYNTNQKSRTHLAIDPYGNIDYETSEGFICKHDYTNYMRNKCMRELYEYVATDLNNEINVLVFILEDSEFFDRYGNGVPVYNEFKEILNTYAFVHFDGPHAIEPLRKEVEFFIPRFEDQAVVVFDDVNVYDHELFEIWLLARGFSLLEKDNRKAMYQFNKL